MSTLRPVSPVSTTHLFRPLQHELVTLLRGLDRTAWDAPTSAGTWTVRDVAAHLLHGDLRIVSAAAGPEPSGRPGRPGGLPEPSFGQIVSIIEADNARGVQFLSTLAPCVIADLLEVTGAWVARLFASLPPDEPAATNVAWAGDSVSPNWMDVGREFTERWHHQLQIRDAVGVPGLTERRWIEPVLRLAVLGLRRTYAGVAAEPGTSLVLTVRGDWRHSWAVHRTTAGWEVLEGLARQPAAVVEMDAVAAARLFFNLPLRDGVAAATLWGDRRLAEPMLATRSLMIREAIR